MQVAISSTRNISQAKSPKDQFNFSTAEDIDIQAMRLNNSQPSGLRLSNTHDRISMKNSKTRASNDKSGGIKKLIKIASSRDGI